MSDFTFDFSETGSDGSATISGGGSSIGVSVSTPTTDGRSFGLRSDGTLRSSGVDEPTSALISFDAAVSDVSFEIYDVDAGSSWDDKVTIIALDADGNQVPVSFSDLIAHHQVNGNTIEGGGNDSPGVEGSGAADTVTVTIPGPIVSLQIIHDNGDSDDSAGVVNIGAISFDAAPVSDGIVSGTAGDDLIDLAYTGDPDGDMVDNNDAILPGEAPNDDIIEAGDGDDTVFAGAGDDEVDAGTGNDTVWGGGGADTIEGGEGNDELHGGGTSPVTHSIDFNDLATGEIVDGQFAGQGVTISSASAGHPPMIFDSSNPTGGDNDLGTGNLGNVLILSEDGDSSDPDDNAGGGTLVFDFANPSDLSSLTFLDNEEGAWVRLYDDSGDLIETQWVAGTGNNSQNVHDINVSGVARMEVELCGSMALDNLVFTSTEADTGDVIDGGAGDDEIFGDAGDDTLIGGTGNDLIEGGTGNDTIDAGDGCDVVEGGDGDDVITTGSGSGSSDYGWPGVFPPDADIYNDRDVVNGGAGNDTISTGDDEDIIDGGSGDDTIDGGLDDDTIDGGTGNDFIIGGHGSDDIDGGSGNDVIYGGMGPGTDPFNIPDENIPGDIFPIGDPVTNNGIDTIHGGDGNDTIYGQDDDDVLYGDAGDDVIDGGIDNDHIEGGDGNDTLIGGQGEDTIIGGAGADTMSGGDDEDTFSGITFDDISVDGGSGGTTPADDFDTLDLTGSVPPGGSLKVTKTNVDSNGNGYDGYVTYYDNAGNVVGTVDFTEIEEIVPCFTPGTMIATPKGERRVEDLKVGDKVITRDNGIQEISWYGEKKLDWRQLNSNSHLRPVLIRAGSLGMGLPEKDMMVSPNHRMLVANERTNLYFSESEVLAAAKHLVNNKGVHNVDTMGVHYIHFMFERHEVVLANGAWTESFQPGDYSLKGLGNAQRSEIFELFPELATKEGLEDYEAARRVLKKNEARLLVR